MRIFGGVVVQWCQFVFFCMQNFETSTHLFISCPFASHLLNWLGDQLHRSIGTTSVVSTLYCIPTRGISQVRDLCIFGIIHTPLYDIKQ